MSAAFQYPDPEPEPVTLATLAPLPVWVAWQTQYRKEGDKKPTKIPYAPRGSQAKANDPTTWGTRALAEQRASRLLKPFGTGGIGLEFSDLGDGRSTGGIDLDSCRDPETGIIAEWAQEMIDRLATYTEISPSQTGAKTFFTYATADVDIIRSAMGSTVQGKPKHSLLWSRGPKGDHPPAIEVHFSNRYFAVTDAILPGCTDELRLIPTADLLHLIKVDGPAFGKSGEDDDEAEAAIGAQEKRSKKRGDGRKTDRTRSATAFAKGKQFRRDGATYDKMVELLRADPDTAAWVADKGEADDQRELRRIWEKAEPKGALIRVVAGELHTVTTAAEDALIASGLPIYQRGETLVRPVVREVPASRGRMTLAAGLGELAVPAMVDMMCAVAEWEKFDARADDWVRINPPSQVAQILLSRKGYWRFPAVSGVITTPTLRPDGSLLTAPGYDPVTRLYHVADKNLQLHPGVHAPDRDLAERALQQLLALLTGFPFVTVVKPGEPVQEVAKSVALSALITPVVRGAMPVAPLHGVNAHAPGSGKSFLIDVVSMIATGRECPVICASPDEAETEKRIAGLLLAGYPVVSIDNCNGELGGDLLCQATERPLIRIRALGSSDIFEIESCVSMFATGNNLRVRGDMVRRSLVAELDPQVERPELREFKSNPVKMIQADRGRYVSACLIIVRAYIAAETPNKLKPVASFEGWSDLVRSALVWLGCADPADSMESAREDDPELAELRELIAVWRDSLAVGEGMTCKQIVEHSECRRLDERGAQTDEYSWPELRKMLLELAGDRGIVNTTKLGSRIRKHAGRVVDGHRIVQEPVKTAVARWRLETVAAKAQ